MEKKQNICVFDIGNVQKEYSYALEFIEILENIQSESDYKNKMKSIRVIMDNISVRGGQVQTGLSAVYYEKPIEKKDPKMNEVIRKEYLDHNLKKLTYSMFSAKMMPFFMNKEMLYHIRIHTNDYNDNFFNLQYLALLLQRLDYMFDRRNNSRKRLSVFIVPNSANVYPFFNNQECFDEQTYINVSKYLQLLSNEYKGVIFGALMGKNNKVDVKALNFKITTPPEDYFPIIPMNGNNYRKLFEKNIPKYILEDVFALAKNSRKRNFRVQPENDTEDGFYDYIAESSFRKLEKSLACQEREETEKLLSDILRVLVKKDEVHWISFALFCFMFRNNDTESLEVQVEELWKLVQNLFDGIKQIVQNAVQHSEKQSCVFSFYMQENEELKILISDLNYSQTIVEKFVETLEAEYEDCENENRKTAIFNLKSKKDVISLRNLFGEFDENDPREEWKNFRRCNSSSHVGLMLFGVTAMRCNAKIVVHSCTSYQLQNPKEYYSYECKDDINVEHNDMKSGTRVIPGTQYTLEIPIISMEKNISLGPAQIQSKGCIQEDYETFAEYLEYKEEELTCDKTFQKIKYTLLNKIYICRAEEKLSVIKQWKLTWKEVLSTLNNKKIPYIDMSIIRKHSILADTDDMEIFIKSFFEAIIDLNLHALAFINVDNQFMRVFKDMCIAFAARDFPRGFQLFVCSDNFMDSLLLCGRNFYEAIHSGYILSIEHGTRELGVFEYVRARELYRKINNTKELNDEEKATKVKVIPFDTILPGSDKDKIFHERITKMSNAEIDGDIPGYRISNTHMRLGSKVHIQSFYEMSFLFYRSSIANRVAFEILQNLIEGVSFPKVNVKEDNLIFYGYASYSKAILTSIVEILNIYRKRRGIPNKAAFISYQHNLQSESEEVQMYYGFPKEFPAQLENNKIIVNDLINIVQIVPISSTLTTFDKMWGRLKQDVFKEDESKLKLMANYSVYWVMHTDKKTEEGKPSPLERKYWQRYNAEKHLIITNFCALNSEIYYFIKQSAIWHNPLSCPMCYPQNLLDEIPLVETDQTSTVPTQQIRNVKKKKNQRTDMPDNNERFLKLKGSVAFGHIKRGKNHFQFYIDTQAYFYNVRDEVREWLCDCRKKDEIDVRNIDFPCVDVIFSPEHNTNVGFAQYVNTYYFGGMAEIVSINEDKEFRSNFECEHKALMNTIEHLLSNIAIESQEDMPVKFYFADDTIISGESFYKANSFLRSLLPVEYKNKHSANIITKCFLLVDRMSDDSKRNYVADVKRDFHSFLHVDVSNVRTQGDSCIGCKLEMDAIRLFKRSSTNHIAAYWSNKITDFESIPYDDKEKIKLYQTEQAYQGLLISHVTQNTIFVDNSYFEYGDVYDSVMAIAFRILGCNVNELNKRVNIPYDTLMGEVQGIDSIFMFLKIVSRPFFSFDFKVKLQVLTLLIALTEILMGNEKQIKEYQCETETVKLYKGFLMEKNRIALTVRLGKLILDRLETSKKIEFIQKCLMRCLTDMRSTYLLRKKTISNFYQYLSNKKGKNGGDQSYADFWNTYAYDIHYIVDCSNDEMRSLGLEYLLLTGKEYNEFMKDAKTENKHDFSPLFLYECITGKQTPENRDSFYIFCHELLLQNTRIHFDCLEKNSERHNNEHAYYMEQWSCVRSLEQFKIYGLEDYPEERQQVLPTYAEKELFDYLRKGNDNTNSLHEVKNKYMNLLNKIVNMVNQKHGVSLRNIRMALLTLSIKSNQQATIGNLDILTEINVGEAGERFRIKERIVKMLNEDEKGVFELSKDGYAISESDGNKPYIVIYFKNEEYEGREKKTEQVAVKLHATDKQLGRTMRTIAKVLLYIGIEENTKNQSFYYSRFILRDLMVYKNRLMRVLETDFASDMFTKYAHTMDEKNIFAHEKAINHNSIRDNDELQMLLEKHTISEKYDALEYNECIKWLSLKNYVNEQIARLFNRCFRMQSEGGENEDERSRVRIEAPQLYIGEKEVEYLSENRFCRKLNYFRELNFLDDDRFVLIMDVIQIEYEDLKGAKMIIKLEKEGEKAYNQEYMKCIILDILLSAIKNSSYRPDFLEKINWYRKQKIWISAGGMLDGDCLGKSKYNQCIVKIYRERCEEEGFDYLVFQNRVVSKIPNYEDANRDIERRLQDPLDYSDGHMSLITIKKYIEGLKEELKDKTVFQYEKKEKELVFVSKLPILEKGD